MFKMIILTQKKELELEKVVSEYYQMIHGEEVHPVNRDLQARIRTLVPL